jgi:hypothetical protein
VLPCDAFKQLSAMILTHYQRFSLTTFKYACHPLSATINGVILTMRPHTTAMAIAWHFHRNSALPPRRHNVAMVTIGGYENVGKSDKI